MQSEPENNGQPNESANTVDNLSPPLLLQLVLDTIPQKVFWKDFNSTYLGCNHSFAEVAGLSAPSEIVGLSDYDLPWAEEESDFYRLCDRRVMDRNQPEIGIVEPQTTADGKQVWLETNKVPLVDGSGTVIGILGTFHDITKLKETEHELQQSLELLEYRVETRTRELKHVAEHDGLTDLANRPHFLELLESTIRQTGRNFALLFIDVDHFKTTNDTLGHAAGDALLVQVSDVLRRIVRPTDVVGRFGGDEFVVILNDLRSRDNVSRVCERIQIELGASIFNDGLSTKISASIGAVLDFDSSYDSPADILRDADIAMYQAKAAGRGCHRIFDGGGETIEAAASPSR